MRMKNYKSYKGKKRIIDLDKVLVLFILLLFGVTVTFQVFWK